MQKYSLIDVKVMEAVSQRGNFPYWLSVAEDLMDTKTMADYRLASKILSALSENGYLLPSDIDDGSFDKPDTFVLLKVWQGIRHRCTHKKNPAYPTYGGRGIKLYPTWMRYAAFERWAFENGYKPGLEIHRKDNNKGYSPDNCEWLSNAEHRQIHRFSKRGHYGLFGMPKGSKTEMHQDLS